MAKHRQTWTNFHFFLTVKFRKNLRRNVYLKLPPPLICCRTTLRNVSGQLYSGTFILVTVTCFMSGSICFMNLYLFIFFFFLILTSIWHYCHILFVALLSPFSCEDKHLAYYWTTHNWCIHWAVAFTTQNMHIYRMRTFYTRDVN